MTGSVLRIGVVGAGNIASIAQLPTLVARDDVDLRALVTRRDDPQPLMRRWGFRSAYPTVKAMLEAEELDAVFILTPRSEHAQATRLALQSGVDVFCEKPLATTAAEAQSLAELALQNERVLMVGFNRRFAPVYEAGHAAFADGGASFCIAQKNRAGSEYRATFENAIHMVDLLRWYCGGEPADVTAHAAGVDRWQEDGVSALIRFDNGNTGVLVAARNAGRWEEKLDAYGGGVTVTISAPDRIAVTRDNVTTVREMSSETFGWATATKTFGFAAAVHHFLDRVRDRQQPLTSGAEAAKTQVLLERILAAAGLPTEEQPGRVWISHAKP
jgi:virulence factor